LKNLGHRVGRSTIARILRVEGIPPSRQRPMTWRTFHQAHWPALVAADFFTTEVWTARGLVTYYVAFLLDVPSRRIQVIGCTPHPNEAFVIQCLRHATGDTGLLSDGRLLLCDRDPKWSSAAEQWLGTAGCACRSDAARRAELQCLCGAVRQVCEGGMPRSHRSAR
jgi:putative transposase